MPLDNHCWCHCCKNTGIAKYYRTSDGNNFKIELLGKEDWVEYSKREDDQSVWIKMIYVSDRNRRQGRAKWMLQRVREHCPNSAIKGFVRDDMANECAEIAAYDHPQI